MKRAVAVLPLAVAALALTGCGNWEDYEYTPRAGTVTELEEEAGYFEEDCYNQQVYDSRTGAWRLLAAAGAWLTSTGDMS